MARRKASKPAPVDGGGGDDLPPPPAAIAPPANLRAEVTMEWPGGEHTFRLTVPMVLELERIGNAPFGVIFNRVQRGEYAIEDVQQVVRLGLIGGGMAPADASRLMRTWGYPARPLTELWQVARVVLHAAMFGFEAAPLSGNGVAAASP